MKKRALSLLALPLLALSILVLPLAVYSSHGTVNVASKFHG